MKKTLTMLAILALLLTLLSGALAETYAVGVCQLMVHPSLDLATQGFQDALTQKAGEAGHTVQIDVQVAGDAALCPTVVNALCARQPDLLMANGTPALLAAANRTASIPVLGTAITDYSDTFSGQIPDNVTGTSDAVPFGEQAQMMIDTLALQPGDPVGVLYCTNETNSLIQYKAVKALFDKAGIDARAYTFSETTEMQAVITAMAGECKAVYVPSDNTVAANDAIVGMLCNDRKVPVYTSYGGSVCYASLAIDYYQLGWETGLMAAEILLNGTAPKDLPIRTLEPAVSYNEELCALLGVALPET